MRGRLPQGNQGRAHRRHESRVQGRHPQPALNDITTKTNRPGNQERFPGRFYLEYDKWHGRAAVPAASSHLLWRGQETTPQQCGTVTFEGKSFKELKKSFKDSVDDYLASCAERDEQPDKPYSGTLRLRLAPELHHRAATAAALAGKV